MKLDFKELERGIKETLSKTGEDYFKPLDTTNSSTVGKAIKGTANVVSAIPRWATNKGISTFQGAKNTYNDLSALAGGAGGLLGGAASLVRNAPKIIDTIGTYAPLAMGAMLLPSLSGGSQGGAGQPVVVNNYMGQRPNALNSQSGVNTLQESFGKAGEALDKKAEGVAEALVSAAKRRMANKVLDTVATPEKHPEEKSQEELEIVTKYPEMAKLLENEQNRAYLNRLLAH